MRLLPLLAVAVVAGCAAPEPPGVERSFPPGTHLTDCTAFPRVDTCRIPTPGSPLAVGASQAQNRSRTDVWLRNDGDRALTLDAEPPPAWVYYRASDGGWDLAAAVRAGDGAGRVLAPGDNASYELHYGKARADDRENDLAWTSPESPEELPAFAYRLCAQSRVEGANGWVRSCVAFRGAR